MASLSDLILLRSTNEKMNLDFFLLLLVIEYREDYFIIILIEMFLDYFHPLFLISHINLRY